MQFYFVYKEDDKKRAKLNCHYKMSQKLSKLTYRWHTKFDE